MKNIIIIPVYNECDSIQDVINDIKENTKEFDYIIINDCSTDKTREICERNKFNIINLPVNLGIGGAVQTGYIYAYRNGYDIAVQFDGDGQHKACYLEEMLKELTKNNLSMVIGSRFLNGNGFQSTNVRRIGIKYFSFLIYLLTKVKIKDPTSGMRMVNRDIIEMFAVSYPKDYPEPESTVMLISEKKKISEIPVEMNKREYGSSSISFIKSIYYMIKVSLAVILASISFKRR